MNSSGLHSTVSPKPYRWGKCQGWSLIILGLMMTATVLTFLIAPKNGHVREFAAAFAQVNDFGLGLVNLARETLVRCDTGDVGGGLGMLAAYLLQTVGTGVGLLKKRMFGLVLFLLLAVRAVGQSYVASPSLVALAFTLGSWPYYYKRWREFRIP